MVNLPYNRFRSEVMFLSAIDIIYYRKANGEIPVKEFIDSLDIKMAAKVARTITLLQDNGAQLRFPYSRYLEDGIYELRTEQGNNISRVLYFFVIGNKAILTNGFTKKTQKTPRKEIKLAKSCREDYMLRVFNQGE